MEEIRFHGRGGQGAVIGSEVLAQAFFIEGKFVQAFPNFGVERRGAPIMAFCRMDHREILLRSQIYQPNHVVVLDASLINTVDVAQGLQRNGTILINSKKNPETYEDAFGQDYRIFVVDASKIAVEHGLGSPSNPIVNTAILGAFARATGLVKIDSIRRAVKEYVPFKKESNANATQMAYERVQTAVMRVS